MVLATYAYSTNTRLDNLKPLAAYLQRQISTALLTVHEENPAALTAFRAG